jgi:arsenate reductase-like glutaredoxin family protein
MPAMLGMTSKDFTQRNANEEVVLLARIAIPVGLLMFTVFGTGPSASLITAVVLGTAATIGFAQWSRLSSHLTSVCRLWSGAYVGDVGQRPRYLLRLYDKETCSECRLVREALSILDIDVQILPCPEPRTGVGVRLRAQLQHRAGDAATQPPCLEDDNTGKRLTGSGNDIVKYLFQTYSRTGKYCFPFTLDEANDALAKAATVMRTLSLYGKYAVASRAPRLDLELYAYESCGECRVVRELLCSLQLPYTLFTAAQGSPARARIVMRMGRLALPILVDPNLDPVERAHRGLGTLDRDPALLNDTAASGLSDDAGGGGGGDGACDGDDAAAKKTAFTSAKLSSSGAAARAMEIVGSDNICRYLHAHYAL